MKLKNTKNRKFKIVIILQFIVIMFFVYQHYTARGAIYGWTQTNWSGGATANPANHNNDQDDWTEFSYKDANIDNTTNPNQITLATTSDAWTENTTAQFNAALEKTNVYIVGDEVVLKKPLGASCSVGAECTVNNCYNNLCLKADGAACASDSECASNICADNTCIGTVTIGSQVWMKYNLNVGTMISAGTAQTNNGTIEKHCYNNLEANCTTYGGLYQWNEAMQYVTTPGTKGICPTGFHIPTDAEQYTLENYLKIVGQTCTPGRIGWECNDAGTKLKPGGSSGWDGLLGGYSGSGSFYHLGSSGFFWSSSVSATLAWSRRLLSGDATVSRYALDQANGFSVRCLKD